MQRSITQSAFTRSTAVFVSAMMVVVCGCGSEAGPDRYHVAGTVTFRGEPVPSGSIKFLPNTQRGGSGPGGFARIKNGEFNTASEGGKGSVSGPHIVSIQGFTGRMITVSRPGGDEMVIPEQLFNEYEQEIDLPKDRSSLTFEVPESLAFKLPKGYSYRKDGK